MTAEYQAVYTHGHHESVLRGHRVRTAENSAGYLLPHLRPGLSVLDVGCGPGTITVDLAARVAPGRVTAIEMTEDALDLARTEAQTRGQSNIDFVTSDVHALDLPDDTFDIVHAHQVLQHVADPVQALREMRRVCKPGGIVAARDADYAGFTWFPQLPAAGPVDDAVLRGGAGQWRRTRCGPAVVVLGSARRVRRHHADRRPVVFRHAGDPRLVGRDVGRPDRRVGPVATAGRVGDGHRRGTRRDRLGVAGLGCRPGRLAGYPAWRDSLPRLAVAWAYHLVTQTILAFSFFASTLSSER